MASQTFPTAMNLSDSFADQVVLNGINFEAEVGLDLWHRASKTQPVQLEVRLTPIGGLEAASQEDSVAYTIDYGKLYKSLKTAVFNGKFESITALYLAIRGSLPETVAWTIIVTLPKAILDADRGLQITWNGRIEAGELPIVDHAMTVRDIHCRCIIGVNGHEKLERQRLVINVTMSGIENRLSPSILAGVDTNPRPSLVYQDMTKEITERVEGSTYETIEALASAIAQIATVGHGFDNARISITKPGGVSGLGSSGVTIGRTRQYFENKDFWKVKRV